jgi:hypothetical protein
MRPGAESLKSASPTPHRRRRRGCSAPGPGWRGRRRWLRMSPTVRAGLTGRVARSPLPSGSPARAARACPAGGLPELELVAAAHQPGNASLSPVPYRRRSAMSRSARLTVRRRAVCGRYCPVKPITRQRSLSVGEGRPIDRLSAPPLLSRLFLALASSRAQASPCSSASSSAALSRGSLIPWRPPGESLASPARRQALRPRRR